MSFEDMTDRWRLSSVWDKTFEVRKWLSKLPYLHFLPHMRVMVAPSHTGAVVRFRVSTDTLLGTGKEDVSVYLDCYHQLGYYGPLDAPQPYWEIYPAGGGGTGRYALADASGLVDGIQDALTWLEAGSPHIDEEGVEV